MLDCVNTTRQKCHAGAKQDDIQLDSASQNINYYETPKHVRDDNALISIQWYIKRDSSALPQNDKFVICVNLCNLWFILSCFRAFVVKKV